MLTRRTSGYCRQSIAAAFTHNTSWLAPSILFFEDDYHFDSVMVLREEHDGMIEVSDDTVGPVFISFIKQFPVTA